MGTIFLVIDLVWGVWMLKIWVIVVWISWDVLYMFPNFSQYCVYVTGSEKTAHFAQDFKIKLLLLKGRVALKQ